MSRRDTGVVVRYSSAFKCQVVKQIEGGKFTVPEARRVYGITGAATIQSWLKAYGKEHLLPRRVIVKMKNESDKVKQLEKEKQALESALAQSQLKVLAMESMIEVAESHYRIKIKKNYGSKAQSGPGKK
ncbi:MAG: transposase [Candidatus Neomarinimicrobiota bacterium]